MAGWAPGPKYWGLNWAPRGPKCRRLWKHVSAICSCWRWPSKLYSPKLAKYLKQH